MRAMSKVLGRIRTQGELAAAAGVSRYTVNRALRGLEEVGESTRKRILSLARQHGYRVHSGASAVVNKRFNCVALVESNVPHRSSVFNGSLFDGVHDALAEHDIHVVVTKMPDDKLLARDEMPKVLRQLMCDGVLMNYFAAIPPQLEEVMRLTQIPAIWMNARRPGNCVYLDDIEGGQRATEHLLALGHRRIAYLDYENSVHNPIHHSIDDRHAGYAKAMKAAGLTPWRLRASDETMPRAERAPFSASWLARPDRPSAVVCYSNKSALPLLLAALEAGVKIPDDLSLVTFEDDPWTEGGRHLTSFRHQWNLLGRTAAELLRQIIDAGDTQESIEPRVLRFAFDPGTTTAPPAKAFKNQTL